MQGSQNVKVFACRRHPSEQIKRICSESGCDNPLCCIECILSLHGTDHKSSLTNITEFIEKAGKHYENLKRIKAKEDSPPTDFTDFLSQEGENMEKLSKHIEAEKQTVDAAISELLSSFSQICFKLKEDIFRQLDDQVTNAKKNYSYYKDKLNNFYNQSDESNVKVTKDDILMRINRANKIDEYELIIKNIVDDFSEAKYLEGTQDQKIATIKEALKEMGNTLKQQTAILPKICYTVQSSLSDLQKEFQTQNQEFIKEKFEIMNPRCEFSIGNVAAIDSKILKSGTEAQMIKKWISNGSVKLKLLWRGTRDGFTSTAFHQKCEAFKPTITLAEATTGKIFGGFTDQDWVIAGSYKQTDNAFLFSVSLKEKYFLKSTGKINSSYAYSNYLPTFGGGHDLYLAESCNSNSSSYANFNYSYDSNGRGRDELTGAYNFQLKEIEVYGVTFTGQLLTDASKHKK